MTWILTPAPPTALHRGRISRHRESRGRHPSGSDGQRGSAGCSASAEREARWASQCVDQLVVRRLAHQLDQLGRAADVERLGRVVRLGVARAVPVEVVPAGAPAAPVVLHDRDLGVRRAVLPLDGAEGPPDRQLPAHVGLGLQGVPALPQSQCVQRAAGAAPAKSARLWKMQAAGRRSRGCGSCARRPRRSRPSRALARLGLAGRCCHRSSVSWSTNPATRFSSALSEKCAPRVQQPVSGEVA